MRPANFQAPFQADLGLSAPSAEQAAAAFLGHGPMLVVDSNDQGVFAAVSGREAACIAFDSRPSVAARLASLVIASFRVSTAEMHYTECFAGVILGCGAHEQGEAGFAARLTQSLLWLAPAGRLIVCLPAAESASQAVQAQIAAHVQAGDLQVRSRPLADGAELVLITKRVARQATVRWEGSRNSTLDGSIALVNCAFVEQLQALDGTVRLLEGAAIASGPPDIVVRHNWPARFQRPFARYYVHMQPWEFGSLPQSWQAALGAIDEVWCYTRYVADIYTRAGFPSDRIHIVPLGFHPPEFSPDYSEQTRALRAQTCLFTFVGGLIRRKGADLAIAAFARAFSARDNVTLAIKGSGTTTFYSQQDDIDIFKPLRDKANAPQCVIIDEHYDTAQLAALYHRSTALLAPFRGEGFGLPALEAMACGTPVVYTAGGAMDDFIVPDLGYPVHAELEFLHRDSLSIGPLFEDGFFLAPDVDELAVTMRSIYENRSAAWTRGARAAEAVHRTMTWQHAAKRAQFRLSQIAEELGLSL